MNTEALPARAPLSHLSKAASALLIFVALLISPLAAGLAAAAADDASFAGSWATQTDKGWHYAMVLKQHGNHVSGSYVAQEDGSKGQISGVVEDNVLNFKWAQSGLTGDGQFALSEDGNSFSGIYNADDDPKLTAEYQHGKWTGTRNGDDTSAPAGTASFAGVLTVKSDKGWSYVFTIEQKGANAQATYIAVEPDGTANETGSMVGKVTGQTLKFHWEQGEFTGKGQFTMTTDRKVTGTYSADPNPKLTAEYMNGTYTGAMNK